MGRLYTARRGGAPSAKGEGAGPAAHSPSRHFDRSEASGEIFPARRFGPCIAQERYLRSTPDGAPVDMTAKVKTEDAAPGHFQHSTRMVDPFAAAATSSGARAGMIRAMSRRVTIRPDAVPRGPAWGRRRAGIPVRGVGIDFVNYSLFKIFSVICCFPHPILGPSTPDVRLRRDSIRGGVFPVRVVRTVRPRFVPGSSRDANSPIGGSGAGARRGAVGGASAKKHCRRTGLSQFAPNRIMAEFRGLSSIEYMSDRYRIRECDPISADASRRNSVEERWKPSPAAPPAIPVQAGRSKAFRSASTSARKAHPSRWSLTRPMACMKA